MYKLLLGCLCLAVIALFCASNQQNTISLAGKWTIRLDQQNVGEHERWTTVRFTDPVNLPGALQAQGYGEKSNLNTSWIGGSGVEKFDLPHYAKYAPYITDENYKHPFWLTPDKYYRGVAWYQKEIDIPKVWEGDRILLTLERCHWETTVYLDDQKIGSDSSLVTPHVYDLTGLVSPGKHLLSIRVNNDLILNVGPNSHSVSDHTQSNWNGLVGDILLKAGSPVYIADVKIFPEVVTKSARVRVKVRDIHDRDVKGRLVLQLESASESAAQQRDIDVQSGETIEMDYPIGEDVRLWDEFAANLYTMIVQLETHLGTDERKVKFGMREFKANGTRFEINGRPVFLRGTLDCCIFPKTGYPPTDPAEWARIFATLKDHGLNHMRFHSWCPPKAAFIAADRAGFYLHVEGPSWANQGASLGDGQPIDRFIYSETKRILDEYGNHPSFVLYAYGNEPAGQNQNEFLGEFVNYWREQDPRRLYTSAAGWPMIPENDYHVTPAPRIQQWGQGLNSIINAQPPQTMYDWRDFVSSQSVPVIGHEIGQWCVYPNFEEMSKYTGYLKPKNFEIFYDLLKRNHMGDQAYDFFMASGTLQALCYKAEIEAALRTPGFAGFQLLDIHDFPGQGTALVGILDPFYESKPYISAKEFRQFCGITVPLARLQKRLYTCSENFEAELEVAHFGALPIETTVLAWSIQKEDGTILGEGRFESELAIDNCQKIGALNVSLAAIEIPSKLTLNVDVVDHGKNSWNFWVYPDSVELSTKNILLTTELSNEVIQQLADGATVLLNLNGKVRKDKGAEVAIGFSSIFWNTAWTDDQPPHTLGVLCDPQHPVFADFPTEYHSNWQWWDIIHSSQAMILDDLPPALRPIIQPIDTWFYARRLGLLFEAQVGQGKIVVTSIDFASDIESRLASRQLYAGLLNYIRSDNFQPQQRLEPERILALYE